MDCPPQGFEQDDILNNAVRARIAAVKPDLLCVALGAPKQEIWMLDECETLPIGAALSVGAAFDTQAGLRKRAPAWTHNLGAEWLYRLLMEPRRLWRRYLLGNLAFAAITVRQWRRQRGEPAPLGPLPSHGNNNRGAKLVPFSEPGTLAAEGPARSIQADKPVDPYHH